MVPVVEGIEELVVVEETGAVLVAADVTDGGADVWLLDDTSLEVDAAAVDEAGNVVSACATPRPKTSELSLQLHPLRP